MIELLARIGLVRLKKDGSVRWPFFIWPRSHWRWLLLDHPVGVFRNLPHVIKWEPGRLLPRRWGIQLWMFELGDRGS